MALVSRGVNKSNKYIPMALSQLPHAGSARRTDAVAAAERVLVVVHASLVSQESQRFKCDYTTCAHGAAPPRNIRNDRRLGTLRTH